MDEKLVLKNRLKEARAERKLSQTQLVEMVGVSRTDLGTSCPKVGQGGLSVIVFVSLWKEAHMEDPVPVKEEYTYQVGKIQFIVTPIYKDKGESMRDILLKLMLADLEPA